MKFLAVTTFNREGYERYARRMLESFDRHWPKRVHLVALAEACDDILPGAPDLLTVAPSIIIFKERYGENPRASGQTGDAYNYRFDAIRFCHKVFAIKAAVEAASAIGADGLIWIDADTITHADIPVAFLEGLLPADADVSYLARHRGHSETGFIVLRMTAPGVRLIERWAAQYLSGAVFDLAEWHDAYVFDHVRRALEREGLRSHSLSGGFEHTNHPFINGPLGAYMDHLKGDRRKAAGRSMLKDLRTLRKESWWSPASCA